MKSNHRGFSSCRESNGRLIRRRDYHLKVFLFTLTKNLDYWIGGSKYTKITFMMGFYFLVSTITDSLSLITYLA